MMICVYIRCYKSLRVLTYIDCIIHKLTNNGCLSCNPGLARFLKCFFCFRSEHAANLGFILGTADNFTCFV